jgi:CHAT domain-containing protein
MLGNPAAANQDLQAALEEIETQRRLLARADRPVFLDHSQQIFEQMAALQVDFFKRPEVAYEYAEQAQARSLLDEVEGEQASARLTIEDIQKQIPDKTALIQFSVERNHLRSWAVTKHDYRFASHAKRERDLQGIVEHFLQAIVNHRARATARLGRELYELLLAPFRDLFPSGVALIIVPDGALHGIPFSALRSSSVKGRYLIQDHPVAVAPSAHIYLRSLKWRRQERAGPLKVLAIGNPTFDRKTFRSLSLLPETVRDAVVVAKFYRSHTLLVGKHATKRAFLELATEHDIIHIGSHALPNVDFPHLSRLVLAGSTDGETGALYAQELIAQHLDRPRLVVLASCGSARGPTSASEGVFSIARAFLAAGVPDVLGTLWNVGDRPAGRFSRELHRRVSVGEPAVGASRAAQLALLQSGDPELAAPEAWAGFELIGAGR